MGRQRWLVITTEKTLVWRRVDMITDIEIEDRATPENPSFNLNDPNAWDLFWDGPSSASGIAINPHKAATVAAVWQCVSQISGDIAKLHLNCVKTDKDATIDKLHPSQWIVRYKWNDETAAYSGWRTILTHALLWGNGYAYIERNGRGDPIGLYGLLPDRTTVERDGGELYYVTETEKPDGSPWLRPIPAINVLHVKGLSTDGTIGVELTRMARDAIGTALATEQFQAKFFRNGVRPAGILEIPREMTQVAKNKIEEGFAKTYAGPDNWFKTVILRDGAKFHQAQASLRESQMVELEENLARKVARFFNLSPSRIGLSDSVSYNSKAEDNQSYLDTTLTPWLMSITSECWMKLLSESRQEQLTHEFRHDVSQLLRMNRLQRYQIYAIGRQAGILTKNDCRIDDGLPPVDGGDVLDEPTSPSGGVDKGANTPPRGQEDQTDGLVSKNYAMNPTACKRRIIYYLSSKARHRSQNPKGFVRFVDEEMDEFIDAEREQLGTSTIIEEIRNGLKRILETASADTLSEEVNNYFFEVEAAS